MSDFEDGGGELELITVLVDDGCDELDELDVPFEVGLTLGRVTLSFLTEFELFDWLESLGV